jgi:L-ascorbate metabolism protein UlaG (beta-lactamase superfamily)
VIQQPVWFPYGSRLGAAFATVDEKIPALGEFVQAIAADLDRGISLAAAVRSAARQYPTAAEAFDLSGEDAFMEAHFALKDSFTFPCETLPATMSFERQDTRMSLRLDSLIARDVASLLALCGAGCSTAEQIRSAFDERAGALFESLLEKSIVVAGTPPLPLRARAVGVPGVTRLQHAGLFYRGCDTGILVDPHFHSSYEPKTLSENFLRSQFEGLVDAILISHGHGDHFHLPTLMTFPANTIIVVPKVPRATMLCPDLAATLRAAGFTRVVTLGWFDPPLSIGDLEVHALPFYGEQPLRSEAPRHPDLRNHGNTYVVRHNSYTSWFLIDSGNDWMGTMAQVAHEVKARFGSVDLLLSNLQEFPVYGPMYITGGGHYWLALTPDQLRRFTSMAKDMITLGPNGVAEICHIVQARQFLPYAHWWGEIGATPDPDEPLMMEQLRSSLAALGAKTKILPWHIGDTYIPTSEEEGVLEPCRHT